MQSDFETLFAQIPAVKRRMQGWTQRFEQTYKALEQRNQQQLRSEARRGYYAYQRAHAILHQRSIEKAGLDELEVVYTFYDRLALAYLSANDEQRRRLRQNIAELPWFGVGYFVTSRAKKIVAPTDTEPLRIALAAISINDWTYYPGNTMVRGDYPDAAGDFAVLINACRQAGLDIVPHLQAVAAASNDQPSRAVEHSPSMRAMMLEEAENAAKAANPGVEMPRCPDVSPLGGPSTLLKNAVATEGRVTDKTPIVVFRFVAQAGEEVSIDMLRSDGSLEPFVVLVDPRGNHLMRSAGDDLRRTHIARFAIKTTGCYYIYASRKALGNGTTSGGFTITLSGASSFS